MGYKKNKKKRLRQRGGKDQEVPEEHSSEEKNETNEMVGESDPLFLRIRKSYDDLAAHKEQAHTKIDPVTGNKVEIHCACTRYVEFVLDLLRTEINCMPSNQPSTEYAERLKKLIASCAGSGSCQDPNIVGEHSKSCIDLTVPKKPRLTTGTESQAESSSSSTNVKDIISERDRAIRQKKVRFSLFEKPLSSIEPVTGAKTTSEADKNTGYKIKLKRSFILDLANEGNSDISLADLLPKLAKKQIENVASSNEKAMKSNEVSIKENSNISDLKKDKNERNEKIVKIKDDLIKNTDGCVEIVNNCIETIDKTKNDKTKEDADMELQGTESLNDNLEENVQKCVENNIDKMGNKSSMENVERINDLEESNEAKDIPLCYEILNEDDNILDEEKGSRNSERHEKSDPENIDVPICPEAHHESENMCDENKTAISESNEKFEPNQIEQQLESNSVDVPICFEDLDTSEDILCEETESEQNKSVERSDIDHIEKHENIEDNSNSVEEIVVSNEEIMVSKSEEIIVTKSKEITNDENVERTESKQDIENKDNILNTNNFQINTDNIYDENTEHLKDNDELENKHKKDIEVTHNTSTNDVNSIGVTKNVESTTEESNKNYTQLLQNIDTVIDLIKNSQSSFIAKFKDTNYDKNIKPEAEIVESSSNNSKLTASVAPSGKKKVKFAEPNNMTSENRDDKTSTIIEKKKTDNKRSNKNRNKDFKEKKTLTEPTGNVNKEETSSNDPNIAKLPVKKNKRRRPKKKNKTATAVIASADDTITNTSNSVQNTETSILKPIENSSKPNNIQTNSTLSAIEERVEDINNSTNIEVINKDTGMSQPLCDFSPIYDDINSSLAQFRARLAKHKFRDPSEYKEFIPRNLNLSGVQPTNIPGSEKPVTSTNINQVLTDNVENVSNKIVAPINKTVSKLLITDSGSESSSSTSLIPVATDQSTLVYSTHSFMWTIETVLLILQGALAGSFRIAHNYEGLPIPLIVQNTMHSIRLSLNTLISHFSFTNQDKFEPRTSIIRELLMPVVNALQDFCPGLSLHAANYFGPLQNNPPVTPLPSYCVQPREENGMYLFETFPVPPVISAPRVPLLNNEDSLRPPHLGVFVTPDGLIRFCLRNTIQIDVTLDNAICLTNLKDKTRMAISASGNFAGIISPLAQVYQHGQVIDMTITDTQIGKKRQAKISQRGVYFRDSTSPHTYQLQEDGTITSNCEFAELNDDFIFSLFFGNSMRGPIYYPQCVSALHSLLKTEVLEDGSIHYYIGKIKISQYRNGHVHVNRKHTNFTMLTVPEILSGNALNPVDQKGFARLTTPVCRITTSVTTVADNSNMKLFLVNHKNMCVHYSMNDLIVSNEEFSAGFSNLYRQQ